MTEPKQPADHPPVEHSSETRHPHAPNGVPPAADDAVATGLPTSDRQATETAAHPDRHDG